MRQASDRSRSRPSRSAAGSSAAGDRMVLPAEGAGETQADQAVNGPVVVLSYAHSGAEQVQDIIAGTGLACTSGTGIIPQCAAAAEAWRQVENQGDHLMSRLAVSTVRGLVTAQITVILATAGKARWCELATAPPQTLQPFLQTFPHAAVLCVHRRCPDVIATTMRASPWGLRNPAFTPYLLAYPGNNVAAIAAYWVNQTDELLAFERANPARTRRIRLEDITARPATVLTTVRDWLKLNSALPRGLLEPSSPELETQQPQSPAEIPAEMIPPALHQHINRLHTELKYLSAG